MMKTMKLITITSVTLLSLGNIQAFSFSSFSGYNSNSNKNKNKIKSNALTAFAPTALKSNADESSSLILDDSYDYDELLNSEAEQERKKSNYVKYGHELWLQHRASDRFYRSLVQFNLSPIVKNLLDEVAILLVVCSIIILWNELLIDGYQDFNGIRHGPIFSDSRLSEIKLVLPSEPFFLCGGPLGLLLVFRNDASYGRYNTGFHLWEKIVSDFNNMLLMISNATGPSNVGKVRDLGMACWALTRTLQHEVSGKFDPVEKYERDMKRRLSSGKQAESILSSRNKLYRAQYQIHQCIEAFSGEITELDKRTLINTVNDVANACVECESLYQTPIPLLYTRHTLKFLTFWLTFMPFAFYELFKDSWNHIMMFPAITVIAFLFFGIEEIAVSLEEPFSILPLSELVEEVALSVDDITSWMSSNEATSDTDTDKDTDTDTEAANEKEPSQTRFFSQNA